MSLSASANGWSNLLIRRLIAGAWIKSLSSKRSIDDSTNHTIWSANLQNGSCSTRRPTDCSIRRHMHPSNLTLCVTVARTNRASTLVICLKPLADGVRYQFHQSNRKWAPYRRYQDEDAPRRICLTENPTDKYDELLIQEYRRSSICT